MATSSIIDTSQRRTDFDEKVDGSARYCADINLPLMLHARTLRSTMPRAKILSIDLPPMPEGYIVVDHRDISGINVLPVGNLDQPFFAKERVNYIGEPILIIAGPERQIVADLIRGAKVQYQAKKPILTVCDAELRQSEHVFGQSPYFSEIEFQKGDLEGAIKQASFSFQEEFHTGYQEHAYLETQSVLATYEDGVVTVFGSMQCPYMVKKALEQALGWEPERVRVVQLPTGGGFGGKEEYPSIPGVHAGLAAVKAGKPVRLVFDRSEDISSTTKRHPSSIKLTSYISHDRRILARDVDIRIDAGAYCGLSNVVLQRLSFASCGVYNIENLRVRAKAVATNNIVSGAFRGFGGPQAFFAIEMHMEHIAKRLGIDPLDFKKGYFLKQGDSSSTGGIFNYPILLDEITKSVEDKSGYRRKRTSYAHSSGDSNRRDGAAPLKGIGCSVFFHGCGFTGSGEKDILKARVKLRKYADGTVEILASSAEIGQGCLTTLRKIVAEALAIPMKNVLHNYPDTSTCPDSGPTVASRTVMIVGKLLQECASEMKQRWLESTFEVSRAYRQQEGLSWDSVKLHGNAYPEYSWGANVVEVEVDPLTLEIEVNGIWSAYDIGMPIDERIVTGQVEGGLVQGLGYASMEVLDSKDGRIMQNNLTTYAIPCSMDFPCISNQLILNPFPGGPYGARGLGELPLIGAAPALAMAVEQAIGRKVHKLPLTPEYLMSLIDSELTDDDE